ncbi:hypothetical protein MVEN_01837800 [Mycena venus]|uniref:Uncharacterized protein n=1 Tax=Mycena venus TaxID=2733690 RepID=A0A8H6XJ45_9AGAR|nr:hypothetical protein MVEN_01837800 [Mycena venus]
MPPSSGISTQTSNVSPQPQALAIQSGSSQTHLKLLYLQVYGFSRSKLVLSQLLSRSILSWFSSPSRDPEAFLQNDRIAMVVKELCITQGGSRYEGLDEAITKPMLDSHSCIEMRLRPAPRTASSHSGKLAQLADLVPALLENMFLI